MILQHVPVKVSTFLKINIFSHHLSHLCSSSIKFRCHTVPIRQQRLCCNKDGAPLLIPNLLSFRNIMLNNNNFNVKFTYYCDSKAILKI